MSIFKDLLWLYQPRRSKPGLKATKRETVGLIVVVGVNSGIIIVEVTVPGIGPIDQR